MFTHLTTYPSHGGYIKNTYVLTDTRSDQEKKPYFSEYGVQKGWFVDQRYQIRCVGYVRDA